VPPVVPPERVAAAIVGLADRPRRARRVGALHALSVPYALAPGPVGRLAARLGGRFFLTGGEPAPHTAGGLFDTRPSPAVGRGGWGRPERARARGIAAGVAVLAGVATAVRFRRGLRS
jgi:hypothetical protein